MSSVWREESWQDAAKEIDQALVDLVGVLANSEEALTLRSEAGDVALVASLQALEGIPLFETRLDAKEASPHRIAFVSLGAKAEARALLRYADVVGIPRGADDEGGEAPEGLVASGVIKVRRTGGSSGSIDVFAPAPVDRGLLMRGAPIEVEEPEDLDAREDWFEKRHEPPSRE